jgi:hypothetical protein
MNRDCGGYEVTTAMSRPAVLVLTVAAILLCGASCGSESESAAPGSGSVNGTWYPVTLHGEALDAAGSSVVLELEDDSRFTAHDGCNALEGTFAREGDGFQVDRQGSAGNNEQCAGGSEVPIATCLFEAHTALVTGAGSMLVVRKAAGKELCTFTSTRPGQQS